MKIILLGAGTAVPTPNRSQAGVLVRQKGIDFLFDIGSGTVSRLAAHGVDPFLLQYIFLTHLHPDHTLDLAAFLQIMVSTPRRTRSAPLFLTGCRGTQDFLAGLLHLYPNIVPDGYDFQLREAAEEQFELEGANISTAFSGHTPTSLSYRVQTSEGAFVYTGDCVPSEELTSLCQGADLLVCECAFPAGWETYDHMDADAVGRLAAQADVKRLVATHLYPPALEADIAAQIGKHYRGSITIAVDGSTFYLPEAGAE